MNKKKIVEAMLKYTPPPDFENLDGCPNFDSWDDISLDSKGLLSKMPNAFFFGALFDRQVPAGKAWEIPYRLKKRLGHLSITRISKMNTKDLALYIGPYKDEKALHRFYNQMSDCLIFACRLLENKYHGNAENIWSGNHNISVVLYRLFEFKGISQKIANMFVRLLITYYGVKLKGWSELDVAVDRHVARVFLRTGLIDSEKRKKDYKISEIKESVILSARDLSPDYPGALDEPAFEIGKYWCTSEKAYCNFEGDPCPLNSVCPKDKTNYSVL